MKLLLIIVIAFTFASCGSWHYSPLDTHIKATIESGKANQKAAAKAKSYIDSINNKF